jgi:hypothetical protein
MSFSLLWLPQVLRDAGLTVTEVPGWMNRGHGDEGQVLGVLCHHTCGPLHGDLPDLNVLVDGRPDLGGPLCNLGLGRSGAFWMIAAGKGWHAGAGNWQGITDGNSHLIGIEAENIGTSDKAGNPLEPWPAVQLNAYKRGCAAILKHVGAKSIMCAGHKEYARPIGRKDDPNFDMVKFRQEVATIMNEPVGRTAPVVAAPTAQAPPKPQPVAAKSVAAKPVPAKLPVSNQNSIDAAFDKAAKDVDPDKA